MPRPGRRYWGDDVVRKARSRFWRWLAAGRWLLAQHDARAQALYKVGDRVAAAIRERYYDSVVLVVKINVNSIPLSYYVHPIGFEPSDEFTAIPPMVHPWGSVQMEPGGGYTDDPYLTAARSLPAGSPLPVPPPLQK